MSTSSDVVVVGAGAIGLAVAWRLTRQGHSVTVCDPAPAQAASHASAGMIAAVSETHFGEEALLRLNLAGARRWPAFARELEEETGEPSGYRLTGSMAIAFDGDDKRELDRLHEHQIALGLPVEPLTVPDARRRLPVLSPRVRGALWIEGDHQADNRQMARSLLAALCGPGVTVEHQLVDRIEAQDGRVEAVTLADGRRLRTGTVVLAAGAWSARLGGLPPSAVPPVRPVKGQILRLRGPQREPVLTTCIRALVRGNHIYVVPRADGRIVVGATQEEQGFDTTVTAEGVHDLLRDLIDLCPGLAELELVETMAGLRPGTPDNGPVVGRTDVEGLIVATGHFRHGILLAPITADAVADLVAAREPPAELVGFGPQRFAGGGL